MVHEIREKNLFQIISTSAKEIGYRTLTAYAVTILLIVVVAVTFILTQTRQTINQSASYDAMTRTFTETFDGNPAAPQQFTQIGQNIWDVQIHGRDSYSQNLPMEAQHGADCSAPPATHHIDGTYEAGVFNCRNHMMTSINAGGYGAIYLTPNAILDFNTEGVVQFELSTGRTSNRDWWDVTISPFTDSQALPLVSDLSQGVDLQGPNSNSLVITTDNGEGSPNLKVVRNGQITPYPNSFFNLFQGITPGTNEFATRQTYKLTVKKTGVKFERLASPTATALLIFDRTIPELDWSRGVVQFGHHSYTPTKACNDDGTCGPNTWHWDNVKLQPADPFTMIKADRRYIDTNSNVTFNTPAPVNSYLRFAAACRVRVDGVIAQKQTDISHPEHASSYFIPIAAGKQSFNITFERDDWFFQNCNAKDFAIWSLTSPSSELPSLTQTQPTPTLAQPTQAQNTPTPTITQTPAPTANSVLLINPATTTVAAGQTFTAEVRVNTNGQSVNAVETVVTFPTNRLSVVGVTKGTAFDVEAENTIGNGNVRLAYGATVPKTGTHTIATITFRALSEGSASVNLTESAIAQSTTNTDVFKSATGATYTIVAPTPTPTATPTLTPTPSPTATPTPLPSQKADYNKSGKVDIQDLSFLLSCWNNQNLSGDLNNDGKINTIDLSILLSAFGT